jgi:hypothetical protein
MHNKKGRALQRATTIFTKKEKAMLPTRIASRANWRQSLRHLAGRHEALSGIQVPQTDGNDR